MRRSARSRRWVVLATLPVVAVSVGVVLAAVGGHGERPRPPLPILRGPRPQVEANLRPIVNRITRRVERLRGLSFKTRPTVSLMGEARLEALGGRLAEAQQSHADLDPASQRAALRLQQASVDFDKLAGLLPPQFTFGPDTKAAGLDRIGGAFDYPRHRIILVPTLIQTRLQLDYTLAHELTHALETEHFKLGLGTLTDPSEASQVRRAVIEGTATFIQDRYRQRYLNDQVPLWQRLQGMRSVIAAAPSAYAVNAQVIFDYVDGALFVRSLHRRAGGWRLVNRALRHSPRSSDQLLHPRSWPASRAARPVRLGIAPILRTDWRRVGGGIAGEERALVILLASTIGSEATAGASGWDGGRFAVWRTRSPEGDCGDECAGGDVGVIGFRWRQHSDVQQFGLAAPGYLNLGLFAEPLHRRTWKVGDGYAALRTAARASALAFAPTRSLSRALARRAAAGAERRA